MFVNMLQSSHTHHYERLKMKKIMIIAAVATTFGFATDFSKMSTEELMKMKGTVPVAERAAFRAEMQKRMQTMTPQERQQYGGPGMGMGKGMGMKNAGNAPSFEDIDSNNDGMISPEEFQQHQMQRRGTPKNGKKCSGKGMGMGMGQGMGQKRMAQMPMFADFDADGNGIISETEWTEGQAKRMSERAEEGRMMKNAGNAPTFADIDTDKDGKVTPAEFQQHQMQQRGTPKNGTKCSGQGTGMGMGKGMQKKCNTSN
jgi:Ca2+-binding EF-hand superfamily protein